MARVLIVDDDDMLRDMIQQTLELEGHEVLTACNGREAVERAERDRPEVVLMDIGMPIMDGHEATRRIKGNPATAAVPVIALTAAANAQDRTQAMDAGADDYEAKPVDFDRLFEKMANLIGRSRP